MHSSEQEVTWACAKSRKRVLRRYFSFTAHFQGSFQVAARHICAHLFPAIFSVAMRNLLYNRHVN